MAVIVNKVPNIPSASQNCFEFCLAMTDIGSGNIVRRLAYQLVSEDGEDITAVEVVRPPQANRNVCLDFTRDIRALVSTSYPSVDFGAAEQDSLVCQSVQLKYWEVVTDVTTCITVEEPSSVTAIIPIWNGVLQIYEETPISVPMLLNHYPDNMEFCVGARPHLWVYRGSSGAPISATYTVSGGQSATINIPSAWCSAILPMYIEGTGLIPHYLNNSLDYLLTISIPSINRVFKITFLGSCCCDGEAMAIMFLDPLGGRGLMEFDCDKEYSMSTSQGEVCAHVNCGTPNVGNSYNVRGHSIQGKVASEVLAFSKFVPSSKAQMEYYKAFLASSEYHVQTVINGSIEFRKFILESGTILYYSSTDEIELRVSGRFAYEYRTISQ